MLDKIKKDFKNKKLFEQALTHKSWLNENSKVRESNERLEFLGDAVLEYLVSKELYNLFPKKREGYLTVLRANLVNTKNLSQVAKRLDLGTSLYLSKGEEEGGGRDNPSLLADTVEAIIGAIFLDRGIDTAEEFVKKYFFSDLSEKLSQPLKDAKSTLQEKVQAKRLPAPAYNVVSESGPDHSKNFVVEVKIANRAVASGEGKSKGEAEQNAATDALGKRLQA